MLGLIPGVQALRGQMPLEVDPKRLRQMAAIMQSMTPQEREDPDTIDGSRRRRIARGSGTSRQEVNLLLKQFRQMRSMLMQLTGGEGPARMSGRMKIPGFRF